jgi:serine/threonine-protein kinase
VADIADQLKDALRNRYVVERELGRGGMATVWLARDLKHGRPVALKVLRPELSAILGSERFLREIQLTAALQHPHILPLLDSGEAAGVLYYVMPYVEGESLRHRLERDEQLPLEEALQLTRGVAAALEYAHRLGVIHRDIKPENILLYQGEPMVADFGIALAAASAGRVRLTETGLSLGTPAYMSPEQASSPAAVDERSDQYSLACVLYEMLAGKPPYTAPTAQAVIAKRFSEPVPHLGTIRSVPAGVEAAVTRALAKAPADRFPSVAAFAAALDQAPPRRLVSRRMAALLGGVAAGGALALAAFLLRPAPPRASMVSRQFTFTGMAGRPAIAPDGHVVTYVSGQRSVVVQSIDGGEPWALNASARYADGPRWTGDGRAVVFVGMQDSLHLAATYAAPREGGAVTRVLEDQVLLDTGPDSTTIVRMPRERPRIEVLDWRTGAALRTIALPDSLQSQGFESVIWSPDRAVFAFEARGAIWTIPAGSGTATRLATGHWPRWAESSRAVYFLDGAPGSEALHRVAVARASGVPAGPIVRLAALPGAKDFDVRGRLLAYTLASTSAQVRALRFGSGGTVVEDRRLTAGTGRATGVAISADGRQVAFSQVRGQEEDVFIVPFEGGGTHPVASSRAVERAPAWSPDGRQLAYVREDTSGGRVVVLDLASGTTRQLGPITAIIYPAMTESRASWSADAAHLSWFGPDRRHATVFDLRTQERRVLALPDSAGSAYGEVLLSPDGRTLVASALRRWTDWGEVWTTPSGSSRWEQVHGPFGESYPIAWSADGWLYLQNHHAFSTDYGPLRWELWRMRGVSGRPALVAQMPEGCDQLSISADGTRAVCVNHRTESDVYLATDFDPAPP